MKLTFTYDEQYDRRCWERLIQAGHMFGKIFPKEVEITNEKIAKAKKAVEVFQAWWDQMNTCEEGLRKIYGHEPPASITAYINTSGYSMDDVEQGYISLSMMRDSQLKVRTTVIHELGHLLFRIHWMSYGISINCSQEEVEEIKEVLTVIHNVVFEGIDDLGYQAHTALRKLALEKWNQTQDLSSVIFKIEQVNRSKSAISDKSCG